MRKHLLYMMLFVAASCMAQKVMKVERKTGLVDRYQTNAVKYVGLQQGNPMALVVETLQGGTTQYYLDDLKRLFFASRESDDSLFHSADGMRQYLVNLYHMQRHGLPSSGSKVPNSQYAYTGLLDGLTDCYQSYWNSFSLTNFYNGNLTASKNPLITYTQDWVWETVSMAWRLIEDINRVEELPMEERSRMVAEAKCLIVCRYFDLLPYYGGLPIVRNSNSGTNESTGLKRATFAETVDFMVGLLDEAIPALPWAKDTSRAEEDGFNRYWTAAGAKALKAKILLLAASPLFNNENSYYDGTTEAEVKHLVWYGNYDAARWERALDACRDFFQSNGESDPLSETLGTAGIYHLVQPTAANANAYRQAFRMGYVDVKSPEVLHSNRAYSIIRGGEYGNGGREEATYGAQATYTWWPWMKLGRSCLPTEEYVEMFPWSDGTPFNWEADNDAGLISGETGKLFFSCQIGRSIVWTATRDPRLYENAVVNGMKKMLDWNSGVPSGDTYELWVGGEDAGYNVVDEGGNIVEKQSTCYADGYGMMRYWLGEEYHRKPLHWVVLSYNEMLLMYAEGLAQTGHLEEALNCVNRVRARVGLSGMEKFNSELKSDKNQLIEEILRERACELGLSGNRYFDQCRYMRYDWMTKQLHGLLTYRLQQSSSGEWERSYNPWIGSDKDFGIQQPYVFEFNRFEITNKRYLWGKDQSSLEVRRMLLWPFPANEIEKNYGLVQNPGW